MKNTKRRLVIELLVFAALLVVAVLSRFWLADIPNFKPVAAIALLSGFLFKRLELALALPLLAMFISDGQIGGYETPIMVAVYGSLVLCPLMGWGAAKLTRKREMGRFGQSVTIMSAGLLMSVVFFVVTNLAVWTQWYESNWAGLLACFAAALPFFKYTLASNLGFSLACLWGYWVVGDMVASRATKSVSDEQVDTASVPG